MPPSALPGQDPAGAGAGQVVILGVSVLSWLTQTQNSDQGSFSGLFAAVQGSESCRGECRAGHGRLCAALAWHRLRWLCAVLNMNMN